MSFLLLINMSYYLIDLYPSKTLIIGKIKYEIYRKLLTDTTNLLYHLIKCFFLCIKLGGSAMKLNMNKVVIIVDSTCDLPKEVVEEKGIVIVPLTVNFPDATYYDGVDITTDKLYKLVAI